MSSRNGHTVEDVFSSPQAHCLRICAYILRRVITGPKSGAVRKCNSTANVALSNIVTDDAASPSEKVKLIIAAFEAFSTVAASFGPSQREDFRALAITLYCGTS